MATSGLSNDTRNFQCVTVASVGVIKLPLRDILASHIQPKDLFQQIKSCSTLKLRQDQLKLCCIPPPDVPDYNKFDVTLLYTLIRNLSSLPRPAQGWGNEPSANDKQISDDIERLRLFRNNYYAHAESAVISDAVFKDIWKNLKLVFRRIQPKMGYSVDYEEELMNIERTKFTDEYLTTFRILLETFAKLEKQTDGRDEPDIFIQGENEILCGGTARFEADVRNVESLCWSITWQKRRGNDINCIDTYMGRYSGSTKKTLVINDVCKEDQGDYQAVLSFTLNGPDYKSRNTIRLHVIGGDDNPVVIENLGDGNQIVIKISGDDSLVVSRREGNITIRCKNIGYNLQDVIKCHFCKNPMPPFHFDICSKHLCEYCKKKRNFDGSTENKVGYQLKSRSNAAQTADLNKTSRKQRKAINKTGEDRDRNTVPSLTKQKINENQTNRQYGSMLASSEEDDYLVQNLVKKKIDKKQTSRLSGSMSALSKEDNYLYQKLVKKNMNKKQTSRLSGSMSALSEEDDYLVPGLVNQKLDKKQTSRLFGSMSALSKEDDYFVPSLVEQQIDKKQTGRLFGSMSALSEGDGNTIDLPDVEPSHLHTVLINKPQVVGVINTEYKELKKELYMVSCGSDGDIWICGNDNILRLYTPRGDFLRSIQTKTGNVPEDIAVTKTGDLVYIDIGDSTVNIVKETEIQTLIILQGLTPRSVCSTSTGDLLVIMDDECYSYANVVRYYGSTEKQSFPYSFGHSMKYITENRNLDICVADCGVCAVVVFNQGGQFRFTYTGPYNTKIPFTPFGITTDSQSRILTADWHNNCVHILDQDGQFLHYIKDRDLHSPWGLCVDTNDTLFVTEIDGGKVKKIQYSERKN